MATLKDVSKASGFSVTTVSRALNDFYDVNEETKKHIREVANRLKYSSNIHAKNLATQKSNRIGFIIFDFGEAAGEDSFVYQMMMGMQKKCVLTGHELLFLFGSVYIPEEHGDIEDLIARYGLAGLIIMGCHNHSEAYEALKAIERPVVCIDGDIETDYVGRVSTDNYKAAYDAVSFLINEKKRRKILMINGKEDSFASLERLRGYRDALGESFSSEDVIYCQYSDTKSYEAVQRMFANRCFNYDAIFCASDMMAVGAMNSLSQNNRKAGKDVDVIGFDDIPISSVISQPLSTVRQDKVMLGEAAVDMLIWIIEHESANRNITVPYQLIKRATT